MARYRVKAYFMHEEEKRAAQAAVASSIIESAEWTPGYVMGVVDEASIPELKNKGLVVSLVESVISSKRAAPPAELAAQSGNLRLQSQLARGPAQRAGTQAQVPLVAAEADPASKIVSRDRKRPEYYLVRFHGPLTRERQADLERLKAGPLERLTRNKYTVHLKPGQVAALARLPFVNWIRIYDKDDTLAPQAATDAPKQRTAIYAVRLHRAKDMRTLLAWLKARKRKPLRKGTDTLHVGLPADGTEVHALADLTEVALIEEVRPARLLDEFAQTILGLPAQAAAGLRLTGKDEMIGIADTGLDVSHPDFQGRIAQVVALGRRNNASDPDGHGTHVAGCAAGDGSASGGKVMGAAPGAKIFFQSILDADGGLGGLPDDLGKLFQQAYKKGVRVHNNSWGAFGFARYGANSHEVDKFVAAHPDMLIVIAAGNEGIGVPRGAGSQMMAKSGFVDWQSVAEPATAKNALTVGASRSSRSSGGYSALTWGDAWGDQYPHPPISKQRISGNDQSLAAFSSRGPCNDHRIKPDVVAPGTDIAAARSREAPLRRFWGAYPNNAHYAFMGGTSMAAPYVAGCAVLVREWYRTQAGYGTPSAALLKATLINGTQRLKAPDARAEVVGNPNFHQGFGRIDMASTLPAPGNRIKLEFVDSWKKPPALKGTGDRVRYSLKVGAGAPLRLCLAWTDPPARALQNELTLLVDCARQSKWIGNAEVASLLKASGDPRDPQNNVQIVSIENPKAATYTIAVTASNLLIGPQHFALVVTGELGSGLDPLAEF